MKTRDSSYYFIVWIIILIGFGIIASCNSGTQKNNEESADQAQPTNLSENSERQTTGSNRTLIDTILNGQPGVSSQWGTGWIDFQHPVDFKTGDSLKLTIGGSAHTILVRLLSVGRLSYGSIT